MTNLWFVSFFMTVVVVGQAAATVLRGDRSFVIAESNSAEEILSRTKRYTTDGSSIKRLRVTSVIVSRFARVTFVGTMENNDNSSKEMVFSVRLPKAAFIAEFNMIVGNVTFVGKVKEQKQAKSDFDRAVERGNAAGLVVTDVRKTQTFEISANVPSQSSVEFHLAYQELLRRRLGEYEHVILINPRQVIDDFGVDVYITETSGITSLFAANPGDKGDIRSEKENGQDIGVVKITKEIRRSKSQAKVSFTPTATEQRLFVNLPEDKQKFTVKYDVTREYLGGDITMRNGYFVHFFAPENLPVLPMKIVFVIDRSGSMQGSKMQQTKSAFASIIKKLREPDMFNIMSFSGDVTSWKPGLVSVTRESVNSAIDHVKGLRASGNTNLNDAALKATDMLNVTILKERESAMIILLTDGEPTSGVKDTAQIRLNVRKAIAGKYSLFCLGFGNNLNHDFLKGLATENDGIARKIYDASDAELQLKGFFQEFATPLLLNVNIQYWGANVMNASQTKFAKYFGGSETVVVGSYDTDSKNKLRSKVTGKSHSGKIQYKTIAKEMSDTFQHWYQDAGAFDNFIERLWAYFTITNLLEKRAILQDQLEIQKTSARVTQLGLKYQFVTPLTFLVVASPKSKIPTTKTTDSLTPSPISSRPSCFARGAFIPGYIARPILCPVLLDPIYTATAGSRSRRRWLISSRNPFPSPRRTIGGPQPMPGSRAFGGYGGRGFFAASSRNKSIPTPQARPTAPAGAMNGSTSGHGLVAVPSQNGSISAPQAEPTAPVGAVSGNSGSQGLVAAPEPVPGQSGSIPIPQAEPTAPAKAMSRTTGSQGLFAAPEPGPGPNRIIGGSQTGQPAQPVLSAGRIIYPPFAQSYFQPELWNECNEYFTDSSATMQLPTLPGPQTAFLCRKEIVLNSDMWIDLHVQLANTTLNEVVIRSKDLIVFSHQGGVSTPQYIYLEHNEAEVVFTVYENDAERPGIVISYQEFSPEEKSTKPTPQLMYYPDIAMANCGGNISSSQTPYGVIVSPSYPEMYPDGAHCLWNLIDDLGYGALKILFVEVDIESSVEGNCTHDKLVIIQGDEEHVICGYKLPQNIMITAKVTKIKFVSDDSLRAAGFKLQYEFVSEL